MWRQTVSFGCIAMYVAWIMAFGLIGLGWLVDVSYVAHLGLATCAAAVVLTLIRDNVRTRRHIYAVQKAAGGGGGTVSEFVRRDDY